MRKLTRNGFSCFIVAMSFADFSNHAIAQSWNEIGICEAPLEEYRVAIDNPNIKIDFQEVDEGIVLKFTSSSTAEHVELRRMAIEILKAKNLAAQRSQNGYGLPAE